MPTIVTVFPSLVWEFVCSDGGFTNALVLGYSAPVVKGHGMASSEDIYYGVRRLANCDEEFLGEKILERVGKYFL